MCTVTCNIAVKYALALSNENSQRLGNIRKQQPTNASNNIRKIKHRKMRYGKEKGSDTSESHLTYIGIFHVEQSQFNT